MAKDIASITNKSLNKYLVTYNIAYLTNAIDDVIGSSGTFTIGSTGKKPYEVSRYRSWDHCYVYFQYLHKKQQEGNDLDPEEKDLACLYLAYYLASWGMYRGSSFVLDFDYKIYEKVVEEILKANKVLWDLDGEINALFGKYKVDIEKEKKEVCVSGSLLNSLKVDKNFIDIVDNIFNLGKAIDNALRDYKIYDNNKYYLNSVIGGGNDIIVSTTLITKIMLGTIGCMPAFDTNFRNGIGFSDSAFRKDYIAYVLLIAIINYTDFASIQNTVGNVAGGRYPYSIMKLLDIYYFTRGAEKDLVNYMEMAEEEIKKRTYSNYSDWFKSLPPNDKKPSTVTQIKVTKAISQVCYSSFNGYEINSAISQERELGEFIRGIVNEKENEERMRKYIKEKKGKDKDLND